MDKRNKRLVELGKDLLIVLLSCSAVYFALSILLPGGVSGLWAKTEGSGSGVVQQQTLSSVTWPVRVAAGKWSGETMIRYGVQYDRESCDAQFESVASLLREALSNHGNMHTVTRTEWERVLSTTSNLYFDLLGEIPFPVLSGWLTGADSQLSGTVRRLVLAVEDDQVNLYYCNEESGDYCAVQAELVTTEQLEAVLATVVDNGARFAFELEEYSVLAGDTMLLPESPKPRAYDVANPLAGMEQAERVEESGVLSQLLTALDFPDSSYLYHGSGTDQVIRSGSDTLRISSDATVRYTRADGESSRYHIPTRGERPTQYEAAETCRQLAEDAVGALAGDARLYLRQMQPYGEGWQVEFGYCLNGAAVQVGEGGYAAYFLVEGSEIVQFTLHLRCYSESGSAAIVLPERQAMAAMAAMGAQGSELMLLYQDQGGDTIQVGWVAG